MKVIEQARQLLIEKKSTQSIEKFSLGASLGQCCGGDVSVLFETHRNQLPMVMIFGAGHIGHALISVLENLPVRVFWVDSRADLFPLSLPKNTKKMIEPIVSDAVVDAPENTIYLVLTHNHQLDFDLCERILKRGDARYLGVIGSQTKAKRFRLRLKHRGFQKTQISKMDCPMGLPEISGKLPAEIAISIAGMVIQVYQNKSNQTVDQYFDYGYGGRRLDELNISKSNLSKSKINDIETSQIDNKN